MLRWKLLTKEKVQKASEGKLKNEAEAVSEKIVVNNYIIIRQASDTGQLYGSVNSGDVKEKLQEEGFSIEKNQVVLDRPIKEIGHHEIRVKLHPEVTSNISIYISRSQEEAEALIKGEITKTETAKEDTINLEEIFEEGAVPESVNEEDVSLDENEVTSEEETNPDSNADLSSEEVEDKSDT